MGQTVQSREGSQRILPRVLREGQNSVFDNPLENALQAIFSLLGGNDPTSQVLGLMNPMETGPMGGAAKAIGRLFDRYRSVTQLPSRLESAVVKLPENRPIPPGQVVSQAKKAGTTDDELAYRLGEFLQQRGTKPVTKAEIEAQLAARPISPEVRTLGEGRIKSFDEWLDDNNVTAAARAEFGGSLRNSYNAFAQSEGQRAGGTKFSRYQVPGGEDYRETLITLPDRVAAGSLEAAQAHEAATAKTLADTRARYDAVWGLPETDENVALFESLKKEMDTATRLNSEAKNARRALEEDRAGVNFKSSHFDDPNILVHTRSNVRELPEVGKGTFLEEVQSDWHQKGKTHGYQTPPLKPGDVEIRHVPNEAIPSDAYWESYDTRTGQLIGRHPGMSTREQVLKEALEVGPRGSALQPPDAPYKDTWQDLALKHHLLEAANDPSTNWLGFTGSETQIARYPELRKIASEVHYSGTNLKVYGLNGETLMSKTGITPAEIADWIGKEPAKKLLAQPRQGTLQSLTNEEFPIGNYEGMQEFYDKLLPARLRKLLKPFGGTVEQGAMPGITSFQEPHPMWFARLTPEMKDRIAREGFPALMALIAAGEITEAEAAEVMPQGAR